MKALLVLFLLYPHEATFEIVREMPLPDHATCRQVRRELNLIYSPPPGFQHSVHCYDADARVSYPPGVWVSDTILRKERLELKNSKPSRGGRPLR